MYTSYIETIAFLGPCGSFSYEAAVKAAQVQLPGSSRAELSAGLIAKKRLRDVFESVESGETCRGIAAIENNVEGVVNETYDLLIEFENVQVCRLFALPIAFDAVALAGDISPKQTISAHPHALSQCREFIRENDLIQTPALSNSAAASELTPGQLALIPSGSQTFSELSLFRSSVQDYSDACTSFAVLQKSSAPSAVEADTCCPEDCSRVEHSIWAITPEREDQPGTLFKILEELSRAGLNITNIFSRPVKGEQSRYTFFFTLVASIPQARSALRAVEQFRNQVQLLGSFSGIIS